MKKLEIAAELGQSELIVPELIKKALQANDRVKYFFSLMQGAWERATNPNSEFSPMKTEREECGVENEIYDAVIEGARAEDGKVAIPEVSTIIKEIYCSVDDMIKPLEIAEGKTIDGFRKRFDNLKKEAREDKGGLLSKKGYDAFVSGKREENDSLHLLVMDVHRALNRLESKFASEDIDGAQTYGVAEKHKPLIKSFMAGVNSTKHLKLEHPGLFTTATTRGGQVVIQNDIGETDAHVIIVQADVKKIKITYSDVHLPRLLFFQSLFEKLNINWSETISKSTTALTDSNYYHMSIGTLETEGEEKTKEALKLIGSKLVFLIDWNRARKRLRNFVKKRDSIEILRWAAENNYGHRAFLNFGGERLIFDAMEAVAKPLIRYGEPLHSIIGQEKAKEYLKSILRICSECMMRQDSEFLLKEQVKTELMQYFISAKRNLLEVCLDHLSISLDAIATLNEMCEHLGNADDKTIAKAASKAKKWESEADALVNKMRMLSKNVENGRFYAEFIFKLDDIIDFVEEAIFKITLLQQLDSKKKIGKKLSALVEILLEATREMYKAVAISAEIHSGAPQADLKEFLSCIDRILICEHRNDDAVRELEADIISYDMDYKSFTILREAINNFERATDSVMNAGMMIKNSIIGIED